MKSTVATTPVITRDNRDYRSEMKGLNQSMLKVYRDDPMDFYFQFVMGEKRKPKDSWSILVGDVLDFIMLDCRGDLVEFEQRFGEKFAIFEGTKSSAQVFTLADVLFEESQKDVVDGVVCTDFMCRFERALYVVQNDSKNPKYKGKTVEKALEDFNENGREYFDKKLENINKVIVDLTVVDKAKFICEQLMSDPFVSDIFNGNDDKEYLTKFPIEWKYTTTKGNIIDCKSEIDIILIDHNKKEVYVKDLKTSYDNEEFEYTYIKYGYYIQNVFYIAAMRYWLDNNGMKDYSIIYGMEFMVADTSRNNRRPLRYTTSKDDLVKGLYGFTLNGKYYKGVIELMNALDWSLENGIFNISKENLENNGIVELKISYGS